jgi:hypothetical protein
VLEKASGRAAESSGSKLALLLHLWLARVCGVESKGGGVEREEIVNDGGSSVDEPLNDLAALVEVVLQVVDMGLGKKTDRRQRRLEVLCCLKKTLDVLLSQETE